MRLQYFARNVVVAGLQIGIRILQHVGDVRGHHRQVTRFSAWRETAVADEVVHGFGHSRRQPARVLVQFDL